MTERGRLGERERERAREEKGGRKGKGRKGKGREEESNKLECTWGLLHGAHTEVNLPYF